MTNSVFIDSKHRAFQAPQTAPLRCDGAKQVTAEPNLLRMFDALSYARVATGNQDIQMVGMQVLLQVALCPNIPMPTLEETIGVSQAAISRNVAKLGIGLTSTQKGAGLLESYEDPDYRRRKLVRLTKAGETVAAGMVAILAGKTT